MTLSESRHKVGLEKVQLIICLFFVLVSEAVYIICT